MPKGKTNESQIIGMDRAFQPIYATRFQLYIRLGNKIQRRHFDLNCFVSNPRPCSNFNNLFSYLQATYNIWEVVPGSHKINRKAIE